jgi:hypothetical protein
MRQKGVNQSVLHFAVQPSATAASTNDLGSLSAER